MSPWLLDILIKPFSSFYLFIYLPYTATHFKSSASMKKVIIFLLLISLCTVSRADYTLHLPIPIPLADLQEYVGVYTFTTSGSPITNFIVTAKQEELFGEADSYGANKLLKQAEADKFVSTSSYGSTIIFIRDAESKKITGLQLVIQGNTLEAAKEK